MIYTLLITILALIIIDVIKNKKLLTPGLIFNGIFFITIFLYSFQLSHIQQTLSDKTLLLLFCCVIAFNVPVFISYYRKPKIVNQKEDSNVKQDKKFVLSKKVEFIIFIITLVIFVIELIYNKGCPLFWKILKQDKTYVDFGIPLLHGCLCAIITLMGSYAIFKPKNLYKYFYLLIPILIISRQILISIVIQGLFLFLLQTKKLNKKHFIIALIIMFVGVVAFAYIGNIRTGESDFISVAQFKEEYSSMPTSFMWIYSYMCFSLSNLNNLLTITNGFINFGLSSLSEICPMSLRHLLPIGQEVYYLVSPNFNVSTFAPSLYLDFGMFGVLAFCFVLGLFATFIYNRLNTGIAYKLMYMVILHNIVLLFFTNFFFKASVIGEILFILLIFLLEKKKNGIIFKKKGKEK